MSAERYEIFDDGPCIRIVSPDSTISTIVGRPVGYHIDDAVIGAIRQQARDIAELRAELQMCCELKREYQERAAVAAEQADQLRADLAAAVAARANMDTDRLEWMTRAEQAEARLAAIDSAPTVAWQWMDTGHFRKNKPDGALVFDWRPLIARPAKDVQA